MNGATPRLWFLAPLETLGSVRVGLGLALALWSAGAATVVAADGATDTSVRFVAMFPLYLGYHLAFAPVVLARLQREVPELEGADRLGVPLQLAASAAAVAMHAMMAALSPSAPVDLFRPLIWLIHFESLSLWLLTVPIVILFLRALWRMRHIGRNARPNLLEATPLAPYGRVATLVALYFGGIIGVGLFVRTTVEVAIGEPVDMGSAPAVSTTMFTLLLLVAAYLPVSGARLAIRAAKQLELTRIADQVGRHTTRCSRSKTDPSARTV